MKPTTPTIEDFLAEPSEYQLVRKQVNNLVSVPALVFKRNGVGRESRGLSGDEETLARRIIVLDAQAREFRAMADTAFKRCVNLGSLIDDLKAQLETAKNLIKL